MAKTTNKKAQSISTSQVDSNQQLQEALQALTNAASTSIAIDNLSNTTDAVNICQSITPINNGSYTINGSDYYNNYTWSNYGVTPNINVKADGVYIEFEGREYKLTELMYRLQLLEQMISQYSQLMSDVMDMKDKLNKIQEELALQKLDQVINS